MTRFALSTGSPQIRCGFDHWTLLHRSFRVDADAACFLGPPRNTINQAAASLAWQLFHDPIDGPDGSPDEVLSFALTFLALNGLADLGHAVKELKFDQVGPLSPTITNINPGPCDGLDARLYRAGGGLYGTPGGWPTASSTTMFLEDPGIFHGFHKQRREKELRNRFCQRMAG